MSDPEFEQHVRELMAGRADALEIEIRDPSDITSGPIAAVADLGRRRHHRGRRTTLAAAAAVVVIAGAAGVMSVTGEDTTDVQVGPDPTAAPTTTLPPRFDITNPPPDACGPVVETQPLSEEFLNSDTARQIREFEVHQLEQPRQGVVGRGMGSDFGYVDNQWIVLFGQVATSEQPEMVPVYETPTSDRIVACWGNPFGWISLDAVAQYGFSFAELHRRSFGHYPDEPSPPVADLTRRAFLAVDADSEEPPSLTALTGQGLDVHEIRATGGMLGARSEAPTASISHGVTSFEPGDWQWFSIPLWSGPRDQLASMLETIGLSTEIGSNGPPTLLIGVVDTSVPDRPTIVDNLVFAVDVTLGPPRADGTYPPPPPDAPVRALHPDIDVEELTGHSTYAEVVAALTAAVQ